MTGFEMKKETYKMYCQQCGKAYIIKASEPNPTCENCKPGRLDFKKRGDHGIHRKDPRSKIN